MSFLRHWRSIVRWVLFHKPEAKWCSTSPLPLIGMMSRSHLFLSGLVSTRARLRFGGRFYLLPIGRIRKPGRHKVAHFSTGAMPHFQPELTHSLSRRSQHCGYWPRSPLALTLFGISFPANGLGERYTLLTAL